MISEDSQRILSQANNIVVAFSGGLDSSVLLHAIMQLVDDKTDRSTIKALHVNHAIQPQADDWAAHCQAVCDNYNIELHTEKLSLQEPVSEAILRQQRYSCFNKYVTDGDVLVLGHHRQDQLETFLFRLFRGSDLGSLTGIPEQRAFGRGRLLRPLMHCTKAELQGYAKQRQLSWIEDGSNSYNNYSRNYIRNTILPAISQRWASFSEKHIDLQKQLTSQKAILIDVAQQDLLYCQQREEKIGSSLCLLTVLTTNRDRLINMLNYWLHQQTGHYIGFNNISAIIDSLLDGSNRQQAYQLKMGTVVKYNQRLYFVPTVPAQLQQQSYQYDGTANKSTWLIDDWLSLSITGGSYRQLEVVKRHGSMRCKPLQRNHSQTLKKLFQEYNVPPWLRDITPVICVNGSIVAVGDVFRCDDQAPFITLEYKTRRETAPS